MPINISISDIKKLVLERWPVVLFGVFVVSVAGYSFVVDYLPAYQLEAQKDSSLAAVLQAAPENLQLVERVKEFDCQLQGPLPDKECSPGAIFENITREVICVSGYTKTVRNVSTATRKKIFAAYGISWPQPFGSYEVDHIIPLSLGGSNEVANLFPESAGPYPGFREKDVVENYLHEHVCSGEIDLAAAQLQIANDWLQVYNNLTDEVIKNYKARYKSWAGSN